MLSSEMILLPLLLLLGVVCYCLVAVYYYFDSKYTTQNNLSQFDLTFCGNFDIKRMTRKHKLFKVGDLSIDRYLPWHMSYYCAVVSCPIYLYLYVKVLVHLKTLRPKLSILGVFLALPLYNAPLLSKI